MMGERASIFNDEDDLNLGDFKPKAPNEAPAVKPEQVRAVAEQSKFRSREPNPQPASTADRAEPWRYRTGRDVQFNAKVKAETKAGYQDIARRLERPLGEVLERALAALQRELDDPRGS